jgi:hypothetical protein
MKTRTLVAALLVSAAGAGVAIPLAASHGNAAVAEARSTATSFFRTIEARQYSETCDLLSRGFYRRNHVPDKRHCVLGLSVGMAMAPSYRFEITSVELTKHGAIVSATANRVPGQIVLIREASGFKVLAVQGA